MNHLRIRGLSAFVLLLFWIPNAYSQTDSLVSPNVFTLGEIVVVANKDKTVITAVDNLRFNRLQVAQALNVLPSITLSAFGSRNESTVYLRGFDLRQIPVYLDGIPIYVAYDGYVDLGRFSTLGLSEISISKGYSSVLYGPNTLGGAINLVSLRPDKPFVMDAVIGIMSGKGYKTALNLGSKFGKFYAQMNVSGVNRDYIVLSDHYKATPHENGGHRENSYTKDLQMGCKLGFMPNNTDEYSLSFSYQHGQKGTPTYAGSDPSIKQRFWQWPNWDKTSLYFISKTSLNDHTYLKTRIYADLFYNKLNSYDDSTYSTRNKPYAFVSIYNDRTLGFTAEAGNTFLPKQLLKLAFHFKNDLHREHNENEPIRHVTDYTTSFGLEDLIEVGQRLTVIPGISFNSRNSLEAETYFSSSDSVASLPENSSNSWNEQLHLSLKINNHYTVFLNIAKKTRFATMKDRYSYKLGAAIPNPSLKPENAVNLELGLNPQTAGKFTFSPALFYSRIYDIIQQISDVQPGISQMQNAGTAQFYGLELNAEYAFSEHIQVGMNYTFIKRENITQPDLKFIDVPDHKFFGYLNLIPVKEIQISLNGEINSKRYSTSYGKTADAFYLLNLRLASDPGRPLGFEAGINNLFDKDYCLTEGYPEQGRNFFVSLLVRFN